MSKANDKLSHIRALQKEADKDLQYLINEAYRILGNPVILYNADFNILAYAEGVNTDDPLWNNHLKDGAIDNNVDIFIAEGFYDRMIGPEKVILLTSDNIKYDRLFGKVYDKGNNILAGVSVVASDKPFEDDDLKATEALCKVLHTAIINIPYYHNYAQQKLETCVNVLLSRELEAVEDKVYFSGYAEMVYRGLKNNLYLAVADTSQCDPAHTRLEYYRDLFKHARPAFKYSIYANYVIIIMSTDEETPFYPKKCFQRLNRVFEQENIRVGISSRFENLFELSRFYNEAVKALDDGLDNDNGQRIFVYNYKQ